MHVIEITGRHCNLVQPERRLDKLSHKNGTTTIHVSMVPGLLVTAFLGFLAFAALFYGALQVPMLLSRSLINNTDWNQFQIFLLIAPVFLAFGGGGFALGAQVWKIIYGNETLIITNKTTQYVDGASRDRSRTAATSSLANLQIKSRVAAKFFESRGALMGSLAGEPFDFGGGLPEDELLKILDYILEHHPNTHG